MFLFSHRKPNIRVYTGAFTGLRAVVHEDDFIMSGEDQDLWWAVRHRCYLSEVFSLLSTNGYEKVAEKFAVMLR